MAQSTSFIKEDTTPYNLAYQGLTEIPTELVPRLMKIKYLDLTNNELSYPIIHCISTCTFNIKYVKCNALDLDYFLSFGSLTIYSVIYVRYLNSLSYRH